MKSLARENLAPYFTGYVQLYVIARLLVQAPHWQFLADPVRRVSGPTTIPSAPSASSAACKWTSAATKRSWAKCSAAIASLYHEAMAEVSRTHARHHIVTAKRAGAPFSFFCQALRSASALRPLSKLSGCRPFPSCFMPNRLVLPLRRLYQRSRRLNMEQAHRRCLLRSAAASHPRSDLSFVAANMRNRHGAAARHPRSLLCRRRLLLEQTPPLSRARAALRRRLLFLDNDVFVNPQAGPLLQEWDSPLIGATSESAQAGWSPEFIARYYDEYSVAQTPPLADSADHQHRRARHSARAGRFLERVYREWKGA